MLPRPGTGGSGGGGSTPSSRLGSPNGRGAIHAIAGLGPTPPGSPDYSSTRQFGGGDASRQETAREGYTPRIRELLTPPDSKLGQALRDVGSRHVKKLAIMASPHGRHEGRKARVYSDVVTLESAMASMCFVSELDDGLHRGER